MRRLIVNADDLGVNAPRTHGIFQCMEEGIVRSATLLVNMPDSLNAARRVKERNISVGLHINLSEGSPLTPEQDVHSLLDTRGYFLGKERTRQACDEGAVEPEHLEREIRAQIEWFFDHCGMPTHVDGHHHLHVHPIVTELLPPILERYGIQRIRIPQEDTSDPRWEISPERLAWIALIRKHAQAARILWESTGLRSTDHFRGIALTGEANARRLRHLIAALPEGTTELMVHPGACDPLGDDFSRNPQRETERNMLLDPELPGLLQSRGIELCSYNDL